MSFNTPGGSKHSMVGINAKMLSITELWKARNGNIDQ